MRAASLTLVVTLSIIGRWAAAQELVSFGGPTMGTRYSVTIAPRDGVTELKEKVATRLAEINGLMSTYDANSELSRFNQYAGDAWFEVNADTARVVEFALDVARSTDGAFDPTVGPAVNLWGFGPDGRRNRPPNETQIEEARQRIGYQCVEVCLDPPALRKDRSDLYLDLSAIAKGYAVDEVAKLLTLGGYRDSLVVIGGEVRGSGSKPDGSRWRVGIEEPDAQGETIERKVQIADMAIGTSGDWQNSYSHDGTRYAHVIDPQTARPVNHQVAGVTVLAKRAIETDAWATALLVMGDERGIAWCERNQVAALFFVRQADGRTVARASHRWAASVRD